MPKKYQARRSEEIKKRDASSRKREPKVQPYVPNPDKPDYEVPIPAEGCTVYWREEKVRREWDTLHLELGLAKEALEEFILTKRRLRPVATNLKPATRNPRWHFPEQY